MKKRAVVQSIGHSVPDKVVTNQDLEKYVDTTDEWIRQRTGIVERRICSDDETASTLAVRASRKALSKAGIEPEDLDLIIVGTVTGDMLFPSTSCLLQRELGAKNAATFDVGAACAGFIYSLSVATAMIESGQAEKLLVVGVDILSKFVDWSDRSTCVLFGDGAGAAVVTAEEGTERGVIKTVLMADGNGAKHIELEVGGSRFPTSKEYSQSHLSTLTMAGSEVYRFAIKSMSDACCKVLQEADMCASDIDLFVPHQANLRIIESASQRLELPPDRVFTNVQKYGNTSGGSIPIALSEAAEAGRLKQGMNVMTVGFGAGLVWGSNIIKW